MSKAKTISHFRFEDMTKQDMVNELNQEYPIKIRRNEDLVNRIHARYPLASKADVAVVVKATFTAFRSLLVLGRVLSFHSLFSNVKLKFFQHRQNGFTYPAVKVAMFTTQLLRGDNE
jgi:hypothetical protein